MIDEVGMLKMGLEKRFNVKVHVEQFIVHWMVEHAAVLINRQQLGHGGEIVYSRVRQRDAPGSQLEFGQQVVARFAPKRSKTKRKLSLAPRSTPAIWVRAHEATTGNIAILQSGEIVRVRTAFSRLRVNLEQILQARATPSDPNPTNLGEEITILRPEVEDNDKSGRGRSS